IPVRRSGDPDRSLRRAHRLLDRAHGYRRAGREAAFSRAVEERKKEGHGRDEDAGRGLQGRTRRPAQVIPEIDRTGAGWIHLARARLHPSGAAVPARTEPRPLLENVALYPARRRTGPGIRRDWLLYRPAVAGRYRVASPRFAVRVWVQYESADRTSPALR